MIYKNNYVETKNVEKDWAPDGNWTHDLSYTSWILYHWATGTHMPWHLRDCVIQSVSQNSINYLARHMSSRGSVLVYTTSVRKVMCSIPVSVLFRALCLCIIVYLSFSMLCDKKQSRQKSSNTVASWKTKIYRIPWKIYT